MVVGLLEKSSRDDVVEAAMKVGQALVGNEVHASNLTRAGAVDHVKALLEDPGRKR